MSTDKPDDKPDFTIGDDDAGFSDTDDEEDRRSQEGTKKQFNTLIRPGLEQKVNAAAFWTDRSKAEIVDEALRLWLSEAEEERGEEFEVLPPHEVEFS
jgi:hypothetical protein